jgi:hypothetical protein
MGLRMDRHDDTPPREAQRAEVAADDELVTQVLSEARQARLRVLCRFAWLRELGVEWSDPRATSSDHDAGIAPSP